MQALFDVRVTDTDAPSYLSQSVADRLSATWGKRYGEVLGWVRARMCFAVIRATNLCLWGSRVCWRSGTGIDDGAGFPAVMPVQN